MCGWRQTNEDAHIAELISLPCGRKALLAGVFDGHGGDQVSKYVARNLREYLIETNEFKQKMYGKALSAAFKNLDEQLIKQEYAEN